MVAILMKLIYQIQKYLNKVNGKFLVIKAFQILLMFYI